MRHLRAFVSTCVYVCVRACACAHDVCCGHLAVLGTVGGGLASSAHEWLPLGLLDGPVEGSCEKSEGAKHEEALYLPTFSHLFDCQ